MIGAFDEISHDDFQSYDRRQVHQQRDKALQSSGLPALPLWSANVAERESSLRFRASLELDLIT